MRVALCGGAELGAAATVLGLEVVEGERPDVVLVDLRDDVACARAAAIDAAVPRVAVAGPAQHALASALGFDASRVASSCEPAALGPLVMAAIPRVARPPTRIVVATAARGGVGRTLLVANLARRLATRIPVAAIDSTGAGSLGWWLGASPPPWTELEGLAEELTAEHLAVVASDGAAGVRVVGGAPVSPSPRLAVSAVRAAASLAEIVLVDAPPLSDERGRALAAIADRALVLSYDDPLSLATLASAELPDAAWLVASQSRLRRIGEREAFRAMPRDEASVASALSQRGSVGGALGRAYDELAEILALDAS